MRRIAPAILALFLTPPIYSAGISGESARPYIHSVSNAISKRIAELALTDIEEYLRYAEANKARKSYERDVLTLKHFTWRPTT